MGLVSGVLIWSGAHLFKRVAPEAEASLGNAGRQLMALLLLAAVVLMTVGYQQASTMAWRPTFMDGWGIQCMADIGFVP